MKLKILFFVLGVIAGFAIAYPLHDVQVASVVAILFGVITVGIVWGSEFVMQSYSPKAILGGALGMAAAALSFFALTEVLGSISIPANIFPYITAALFLLLFHIGITIGVNKGREADDAGHRSSTRGGEKPKFLIPVLLSTEESRMWPR